MALSSGIVVWSGLEVCGAWAGKISQICAGRVEILRERKKNFNPYGTVSHIRQHFQPIHCTPAVVRVPNYKRINIERREQDQAALHISPHTSTRHSSSSFNPILDWTRDSSRLRIRYVPRLDGAQCKAKFLTSRHGRKQARSQVIKFGGHNTFLGGQYFCFIVCSKQILLIFSD